MFIVENASSANKRTTNRRKDPSTPPSEARQLREEGGYALVRSSHAVFALELSGFSFRTVTRNTRSNSPAVDPPRTNDYKVSAPQVRITR